MAVKDLNEVAAIDGEYVDKTEEVVPARANEIALEIKIITRDASEYVVRSGIKVGQRLKEAKTLLPHGMWEDWLRDHVEYSVSQAQRFMKLADAYEGQLAAGDEDMAELFATMLPSKALVLAQLPPAQQKEFVRDHNPDEMSVREMKAAVKAKEEAEKANTELKKQLEEVQQQLQEAQAAGEISPEERAKIEAEAKKAAEEAVKAKMETAKKKADKELEKARTEGKEALEKVKAEQEQAIKAASEKARAEAKAEVEQAVAGKVAKLEEQVAALEAQASPFRVRFGENLEGLKAAYGRMVAVVEEAEREEPDEGKVLREILNKVVTMLAAAE